MVGVHLGALLCGQHLDHDQAAIHRRHGQGLEAQHRPLAAGDHGRLCDELQVLDPDAVGAFLVIARLVGHDHPRLQGHEVRQFGDTLRAFVHTEIRADAVTGAVVVVQALKPERGAGQGVEGRARGPGRETDGGQGQMALQHQGETLAHLLAGFAHGDRAGDVGGAVQVLGAGID